MCNFLSAVMLKRKNVIAPMYNQSHSRLIENMGIEDDSFNASKVFVRAELRPYNNDLTSDISKWKFVVDQDVVPDWYENDSKGYEERLRNDAEDWMKKNIVVICGVPCTKLKEENGYTYFHTCMPLFNSSFGDNNDYKESNIRRELLESEFLEKLKKKYADELIPTSINLRSLDGLDDYGVLNEDYLSIPDIDIYRECRKNIFAGDKWWWLSTPDSTSAGCGSSVARYVRDGGGVDWNSCGCCGGVRPFFILKSHIFESLD